MTFPCGITSKLESYFLWALLSFVLSSCSTAPKETWHVMTPTKQIEKTAWSEEELSKDPAVRAIEITENSSFHVIHLTGTEKPHTHDDHDLYAFMVSGEAKLKMSGKEFIMKKGDAVMIPKGTVHWAQNISLEGSEALIVFSPALTDPDYHELGKRTL